MDKQSHRRSVVILMRLCVLASLFLHYNTIFKNDTLFINAFTAVSKSINNYPLVNEVGKNPNSNNALSNICINRRRKDPSSFVVVCWMAKGDGKKSRKKQELTVTAPVAPAAPSPQRVTNDINIPVRRQIKWAQMKKEALRNSGTSFRQTNVKRTAYRKSLDEEEIESARIERKRRGQEPEWDVILNATLSTPLVLVDAYNIIYKWPRLKKWMVKGNLQKARDTLIYDLEELRALKGWRIEVIFDGFGKSTTGPLGDAPGGIKRNEMISKSDQQASKKVTEHGVRVVYSGAGMSADGYIEERCMEAKKITDGKITGSLIVASDDNMIRTVATSAGAICMSADRMVNELKSLRSATMSRVEVALAQANGHEIRPVQLQGKVMPNRFRSAVIEDKRSKKEELKKKKSEDEKPKMTLDDLKKGTKSLPSWAVVPEQKK